MSTRIETVCKGRTGCVGVSYVESWNGRKRTAGPRRYFAAHIRVQRGGKVRAVNRKFSIDRLGKQAAWERAVRFRAQYELTVLAARQPEGRAA